ncbi:AAA family ATPase [Aquimarina sp. 2201CG5-10]|uniref:AAA family ATPase n=1 Tax=Aquimarina callyspongiae TaxID=3098150 RepID=UPI002AB5B5E8|nr:AAA family ATPase [Aquimarina sp. 2201CG5-10]MDY8136610.1 AAA family ATPase [Aquimarina sp. 2201CG5-10]
MHKRIIITGAPGTGKTSLIGALKQSGFHCHDEISRKIITEQQKQKTDKTPWGDLMGFVDLVYHQTMEELNTPINQNIFVDRGLPDTIAYLKANSSLIPEYLLSFPYKTHYASTVFLAPFWKEIYVNDPQRPQSNNEAIKIHKSLLKVYEELNFKIEILPKATLTKRVDFIRSII